MPDKPTSDWTDDQAFWAEAWADMDQRLDARDRQRRGAWWYFGLVSVAIAAALGLFFWSGFTPTERSTALIPTLTSAPTIAASPAPASAPEKTSPSRPSAAAPTPTTSPVFRRSFTRSSQPKVTETTTAKVTTPSPPATPMSTTVAQPGRTIAAVVALPSRLIPLLEAPKTSPPHPERLKAALAIKKLRKHKLFFEGGASAGAGRNTTGQYLGLGYALPLGERWTFSSTVRYRQDKHAPRSGGGLFSSSNEDLSISVPEGEPEPDSTQLSALRQLGALQDATIRTQAVETVLRIDYRIGKRFQLGGGAGIAYQLSADAQTPTPTATTSVGIPPTQAEFTNELFDESSLRSNLGFNNNSQNARQYTVPALNRWLVRSYVHTRYQLTPRMGFQLSWSILLNDFDTQNVLNVQRNRWELGVRYGF